MPFNNLSTVVKISGNKVQELFQYLNNDNKQHPVSGLKIIFNQKKIQNVLIQNKKFNINKSYYVLTSNFLQEGGDKMDFFINPLELYNLETNMREVVIKHITMKKKIEVKLDNRIQRIK
jgi:5'-nucleotidase